MKYKVEWLIVGFGVFWLIELLAYFNNDYCKLPLRALLLPFLFWAVGSYIDWAIGGRK